MPLPNRPKGNSDSYLKIDSEKSVEGVLIGDPSFFYRAYQDGKYIYKDIYEPDYSFRFQMNFIVREPDGKLTPLIFENGGPFYDKLTEFSKTYEIGKTWIRISRTGTKKDTRYDFLPIPKHEVSDEQLEVLHKAELHSLRGLTEDVFKQATKEPGEIKEDDVPY